MSRGVNGRAAAETATSLPSVLDQVGVFLGALAFYWLTLAPTVIWGDSASLATEAFTGPVRFGTAGDHPFFTLLSRLFVALPGDVARNVNLVSAVFGALTVMLVFRCAQQLGAGRLASAAGASALAVSHAFWQHAVIAEVYTANAFFAAATLALMFEWRRTGSNLTLAVAAATFLVGLTNHLVLGTMLPAVVAFVVLVKKRAAWRIVMGVALVALALALVLALVAPAELMRAARRLWFGPPGIADYFDLRVDAPALLLEALYYLAFLAYQFPSISLVLGLAGAVVLVGRDRQAAVLLLLAAGVNALTFVRHTVWPSAGSSKYVFYIPDYVVFAILCAVGVDTVLRRWRSAERSGLTQRAIGLVAVIALVPPTLYAMAPVLVKSLGVPLPVGRTLPYRDNDRFFLNPDKHAERGVRRFGEEALGVAEPGAVIYADYTPYAVLRYLQIVEHKRPDVLLVSSTPADQIVHVRRLTDTQGRSRPVYVVRDVTVDYDLSGVPRPFDLIPAGPLLAVSSSH